MKVYPTPWLGPLIYPRGPPCLAAHFFHQIKTLFFNSRIAFVSVGLGLLYRGLVNAGAKFLFLRPVRQS